MAKKTLGNGERIISTHTRNINNKRADERPVGGGIVVPERSGIFAKDNVQAVCYTDFWESYQGIIPGKRHKAVGKDTGKTNHVERFNNIMSPRISRLVRKTLFFSKKLENHIGAIWYFIHYYNASLCN